MTFDLRTGHPMRQIQHAHDACGTRPNRANALPRAFSRCIIYKRESSDYHKLF